MKRIFTLLLFLVSYIASINATDFYSKVAAVDPNAPASWNTMADGSGTDAVAGDYTATGNKFIVQTGTTMTTTAAFAFGGTTTTFQIQTGGSLQANHTVTFAAGNTFQIDNGGTFIQNIGMAMGSTVFAGTEAFGASSNYSILVIPSGTSLPSGSGYGNLTINTPANAGNFGWGNTIVTIQGNLTVISTGTGVNEQRLSASTASNVTIGGNLDIQGGVFVLSSGTAATTLTVTGTSTISGGTLILSGGSGNTTFNPNGGFTQSGGTLNLGISTGIGTVNATGAFTQSAGTITKSAGSAASIVAFAGSSLQNVTLSGTTTLGVNFGISNPVGISLTGTMTINQGASLFIATGAADPVQGAGTVSYLGALTSTAVMANLKYMTVAGATYTGGAQTITDKVWPATNGPNAFFLDNTSTAPNNKVTSALTGDRTLIGGGSSANQLTITNGIFDIANSSIALGLNAASSISSPSASKMIVTSGTGYFKVYFAAIAFSSFTFPVGDISGTVDYSELYLLYSSAASAASFIGVRVENNTISGDSPGADYAARNWSIKHETVASNVPSGSAFTSSPAFNMQINGKGPTTDVTGTATNMRLFKKVGATYTQLNSGSSVSSPNYNSGNAFYTGTFPAVSETSLDGYVYAPRTYLGQQTYTWNGSVDNAYTNAANWTPARSSLDAADILQFNGTPTSPTVTGVAAETIGKIVLTGGAQVTWSSAVTTTISGGIGTGTVECLNVCATCKLTSALTGGSIDLSGPTSASARTATVDGTLEATAGTIRISSSNSATLTMSSGSTLKLSGTGVFTNSGSTAAFVLSNGATFNMDKTTGSMPGGTYVLGSNVILGSVTNPYTSTPVPSTTATGFNSNLNMTYNYSFSQGFSATAATTFPGTWTISQVGSGTGRFRLTATNTNTLTFSGQFTSSAQVAGGGLEFQNVASLASPSIYNFTYTTSSPSLNISSGGMYQTTVTATNNTARINVSNGLTLGNNTTITANTSATPASGLFEIRINGGDLTFGTGTTAVGQTSANTNTTTLTLQFLGSAAQNFTPPVTTTGRCSLLVNNGAANGLTLLTRGFTANIVQLSSKLTLGSNDLTITPVGTAVSAGALNGSSTNYVITNGTGKVTFTNVVGATGKTFRIGTSSTSYDEVFINPTTTSSFSANVKASITNTVSSPAKAVQREWDIVRNSGTGAVQLDFLPNASALTVNNTPSGAVGVIGHWNGTSWDADISATYSFGAWSVASYTGTFSPFIVAAPGSVLAAEFTNITAQAKGSMNVINFATATEKDVKEFAIERSVNNRTWEVIGTKAAIGGTTPANYSFNDVNPTTLSYYRVRSVEANGKDQISKVVAVKRNGGKLAVLAVSPVPTTEGVTVDVSTSKIGTLNIVITDIVGKVVKTATFTTVEGTNTLPLNLSNLSVGTYILTINDGEIMAIQRIVKQ